MSQRREGSFTQPVLTGLDYQAPQNTPSQARGHDPSGGPLLGRSALHTRILASLSPHVTDGHGQVETASQCPYCPAAPSAVCGMWQRGAPTGGAEMTASRAARS